MTTRTLFRYTDSKASNLVALRAAADPQGAVWLSHNEELIGAATISFDMVEFTTVAFSDSSLFRPRKVDEPVPVAGYLILPPVPADQIPRMGTLEFEGYRSARYPPADAMPMFVGDAGEYRVTPAVSTAAAAVSMTTDSAFLADDTDKLPAPIESIARSRAGKGLAVWDLLAHYSALRRLKRLGEAHGTITFRTDGELPDWVSRKKTVTVEVDGENIAPALLELIREAEAELPPIRRETLLGWNVAEGPIRQVITLGRRNARRADLEVAKELGQRVHFV
jgi:hypothetical protein